MRASPHTRLPVQTSAWRGTVAGTVLPDASRIVKNAWPAVTPVSHAGSANQAARRQRRRPQPGVTSPPRRRPHFATKSCQECRRGCCLLSTRVPARSPRFLPRAQLQLPVTLRYAVGNAPPDPQYPLPTVPVCLTAALPPAPPRQELGPPPRPRPTAAQPPPCPRCGPECPPPAPPPPHWPPRSPPPPPPGPA